jgi:hypothetical protein
VGDDHIRTVTGKFDLARCLMETEQFSEAEDLLVTVVSWLRANRVTRTASHKLRRLSS